ILKVYVTGLQSNLDLKLSYGDQTLLHETVCIEPELVYKREIPVQDLDENQLLLTINSANGRELFKYDAANNKLNNIPEAAKPALMPDAVENTEQLFLTGQHLEQYRHATYSPVPYYEEALKRDPKDIRNNNALGLWYLRRGQFTKSESYFRKAIETLTGRNPNPYDSEAYYNLGLSLKYQDRI